MPESPGQQPKKSDKSGPQPEKPAANARSIFGPDKSIVQSLPVAIIAFDQDLRIIEANPQATKLLGLGDYIDKSLAEGTDHKVWAGWTEQLRSALSTAQPCTFDEVSYTSNGRTRLLRITCTPLKDAGAQGTLGGTIIVEDITEMANVQRQLADAERLAAVGKLASKVAHELNNPMDGILRYINLAMRIVEQENLEKPKEYLTQCRKGLMRMVQIVSELLEFSRSTYASPEYVRIEQLIEEAVKTMESRAEALDIRILRDYDRGIPEIRSGNLFQVFCILTKIALVAMPQGGELRISTWIAGQNTAVVEFRDSGSGFAPENADALFEPFFTTKDRGKGTGLGLAICRDIVESYHGRITAENIPDGGSVFIVFLPLPGK